MGLEKHREEEPGEEEEVDASRKKPVCTGVRAGKKAGSAERGVWLVSLEGDSGEDTSDLCAGGRTHPPPPHQGVCSRVLVADDN